jgi:hypothetical protein
MMPGNPGSANVDSNNPYRNVGKNDTWFSPLNRSDYEDMSWNLNKLKFMNDINQSFPPDAPLMKENAHRQHSDLYQNNLAPSTGDNSNPPYAVTSQLRPQFNMVFNTGSVSYDFMNKGDGPLKAIVCVWRVKKGQVMSNNIDVYNPQGTAPMPVPSSYNNYRGVPGQLFTGIGQGYRDSMLAKFGTDSLNGIMPAAEDVWEDPNQPFLPVTRYAHQSDLPCKEVSRFEFALASGARRNVTIDFGGDIYDPTTIQQRRNTYGAAINVLYPEIIDGHSYIICISTAGTRNSRAYNAAIPSDP